MTGLQSACRHRIARDRPTERRNAIDADACGPEASHLQLGQPRHHVSPGHPSAPKEQGDLQAAARLVGWSQGENAAAATGKGVLEWTGAAARAPGASTHDVETARA